MSWLDGSSPLSFQVCTAKHVRRDSGAAEASQWALLEFLERMTRSSRSCEITRLQELQELQAHSETAYHVTTSMNKVGSNSLIWGCLAFHVNKASSLSPVVNYVDQNIVTIFIYNPKCYILKVARCCVHLDWRELGVMVTENRPWAYLEHSGASRIFQSRFVAHAV